MSKSNVIDAINKVKSYLDYVNEGIQNEASYDTLENDLDDVYTELGNLADEFEEYSDKVENIQDDLEEVVKRLEDLK